MPLIEDLAMEIWLMSQFLVKFLLFFAQLLVLKLQAEFSFLCKSSINMIHAAALANFYLNILKNINLSIL